mmetsp:Transcript_66040/g.190555  ORF Transcript_66040/g.190555 Transcript_66040/m.190555 type:complete len:306 (+) Transcript_66040:3509-4426(+)
MQAPRQQERRPARGRRRRRAGVRGRRAELHEVLGGGLGRLRRHPRAGGLRMLTAALLDECARRAAEQLAGGVRPVVVLDGLGLHSCRARRAGASRLRRTRRRRGSCNPCRHRGRRDCGASNDGADGGAPTNIRGLVPLRRRPGDQKLGERPLSGPGVPPEAAGPKLQAVGRREAARSHVVENHATLVRAAEAVGDGQVQHSGEQRCVHGPCRGRIASAGRSPLVANLRRHRLGRLQPWLLLRRALPRPSVQGALLLLRRLPGDPRRTVDGGRGLRRQLPLILRLPRRRWLRCHVCPMRCRCRRRS